MCSTRKGTLQRTEKEQKASSALSQAQGNQRMTKNFAPKLVLDHFSRRVYYGLHFRPQVCGPVCTRVALL